ncbi:MAG: hypothetical protein KC643_18355, partial [Nitrospira sp.]|nr:hypothetical protein [Nitrospira sp.]
KTLPLSQISKGLRQVVKIEPDIPRKRGHLEQTAVVVANFVAPTADQFPSSPRRPGTAPFIFVNLPSAA